MSKRTETQVQSHGGLDVRKTGSLDYSKAEKTIENIVIPGSRLMAKWVKDKGYAIGFENLQVTGYYDELEKALNKIGYSVDKEDQLYKLEGTDFEVIVRIILAVTATMIENLKTEVQNEVNEVLENELGKVVNNG